MPQPTTRPMDLETLKEEIRARADIVDIVGRVVKLTKASGSWKGLCPFHQEKTPSFNVNPSRQSYHCFGCGAGGDVFKFVMEYEHLDFMAAMEKLAQQTGVPFELDGSKGNAGNKQKLLDLHERACAFFESSLREGSAGETARAYVKNRELQPDTPDTFRLGFAPDSYEALLKQAQQWGFSEQELTDSGLFIVRDNPRDGENLFDRFRNRLMFPILDEQGRVIGFSGRVIPPGEAKAKYLNSPETLLFKKSRVLYGIDKARKRMTEMRRAVLCEGQLDVIRCHESGITEAVAAQGTAVTETHAQILKRYSDEVILLLDADAAGIKAALRSADVLLACGISTRVASLPPGEDPDDVVRKYGPKRLCELVESAEPFVVFQVKTLVGQEEEITETSRLRVARQVMGSIAKVKEAVHREELIRQAAGALGMREETLRQDLQSTAALQAELPRPRTRAPTRNPWSPTVAPTGKREDIIPPSEKLLIELLLSHPEGLTTAQQYVHCDHLGHNEAKDLLAALYEVAATTREAILDLCRDHPMGEKLIALDQRSTLQFGSELGTPEEALQEIIMILRRESLTRSRKTLHDKSRTLTSREEKGELETEIWKISMHERQLKEYAILREWPKARLLLDMIDGQM